MLVAVFGCSRTYQTPEFSRESRNAIAVSIQNLRKDLEHSLSWVPAAICELGTCFEGSSEVCMGPEREAAIIRFVWLSCFDDPIQYTDQYTDKSLSEGGGASARVETSTVLGDAASGKPSGQERSSQARVQATVKDCSPMHMDKYRALMSERSTEQGQWLREQLSEVDLLRKRLRAELPGHFTRLEEEVQQLDIRVATIRARYQSQMESLRQSNAPGDVLGTWEDRYQSAMTDLRALEERLHELQGEVSRSTEYARRRYSEAAARIASSGYPEWEVVRCNADRVEQTLDE